VSRAAGSCGDILLARSIGFDAGDNLPEGHRGLPGVYADSWLDVMDHRNMDSPSDDGDWQGPYQCDEEGKKDWLFGVLLLTLILPFL
jgi:hypothetical protein